MPRMTNRGIYLLFQKYYRSADIFHVALLTGSPVSITGASNATPISITAAAHGYSTGDLVLIYGVQGNTAANGVFKVTVVDVNNFTLDGSVGNGVYVSGGTVVKAPGEDVNTMADVTQIAIGNGYSDGGQSLTGNVTDFPTLTEDDANDKTIVGLRSITFNASGGSIPASGNAAYFIALTTDHATVTSREIISVFSLDDAVIVSDGNPLTLNTIQMELRHQ